MRRAIIFANGHMNKPPDIARLLNSAQVIIAADGGMVNCKLAGVVPHILIGDLDSTQSSDLAALQEQGIEVIQYPTHKDETDLELALFFVVSHSYNEVYILGALGDRWDMTVANILLLAHPKFSQVEIHIMDGFQELILLRPGMENILSGHPGKTVSLIPLNGNSENVTTHGLEYPLADETLLFGATRGISNVFTQATAHVSFDKGLLLCVINHADQVENSSSV